MSYTITLAFIFLKLMIGITAISIITLIIAITIHEFSHAFMADRLGDPTPRSQGRLTLNPLAHLDPLGTIMILFANFGWGKPVQIDSYNFSQPRRDELLVAFAGPLSNLIMATLAAISMNFIGNNLFIISFVKMFVNINVFLAVFNLLPIPPLDGSKIFLNLLPVDSSHEWEQAFERYGFVILILLVFLPVGSGNLISLIINPIAGFVLRILSLLA